MAGEGNVPQEATREVLEEFLKPVRTAPTLVRVIGPELSTASAKNVVDPEVVFVTDQPVSDQAPTENWGEDFSVHF